MQKILFILFFFFSLKITAQVTDTIEVSFTKSVYLIFPEATNYDRGSEDVLIKNPENKIIIQAAVENFEETNLFVQSGPEYYMFILKYSTNPKKLLFNYQVRKNTTSSVSATAPIITEKVNTSTTSPSTQTSNTPTPNLPSEALGNEMIDQSVYTTKLESQKTTKETKTTHETNAIWANAQQQTIFNKGIVNGKISFIATNLYVYENYFYLKLSVINKSKINYDIDFIRFTIKNKSKSVKKAADQYIELTPIYIHNKDIKTAPGQETIEYIYVFDKFTIEDNKKFNIEMWEKNGDRKLGFDFLSKELLGIKRID